MSALVCLCILYDQTSCWFSVAGREGQSFGIFVLPSYETSDLVQNESKEINRIQQEKYDQVGIMRLV